MKIPPWPAWFPYPISWLRGFLLSKSFSFIVVSGLPEVTNNGDFFILLGFAWLVQPFLFTFFHFLVSGTLEVLVTNLPSQTPGYIRQWFADRRCLGAWRHWREGLNAFVCLFFAFMASLFIAALFISDPSHRQESLWKIGIALASLPVTAAYIYQYDLWARHRRAVKSAAKAKAQEPAKRRSPVADLPSVNPIEVELNQLAAESGDARMRPVRRPSPDPKPKPETPQWYVFRSGKSEGPYTKDQLRDVQRITDRTKVRREQAEWVKAGEVPELANYLTQK